MTDSPAFDPGPRPELAWLPVALLSVDPSYQRTIEGRVSQAAITRIAEKFNWACFGVVMVAEAEGGSRWVIIDGQHRVEAARRRNLTTVPAIIVPAASQSIQAQIFLATNRLRVTVNPYAMHHAQLAAGEQQALDTQALADKAGIEIPRYPIPKDRLGCGQTMALGTIKSASADRNGTKAVMIVGKAWAARKGGIPAIAIRAAWHAMDAGAPAENVERWLERNKGFVVFAGNSMALMRDLAAVMLRSSGGAK